MSTGEERCDAEAVAAHPEGSPRTVIRFGGRDGCHAGLPTCAKPVTERSRSRWDIGARGRKIRLYPGPMLGGAW